MYVMSCIPMGASTQRTGSVISSLDNYYFYSLHLHYLHALSSLRGSISPWCNLDIDYVNYHVPESIITILGQ